MHSVLSVQITTCTDSLLSSQQLTLIIRGTKQKTHSSAHLILYPSNIPSHLLHHYPAPSHDHRMLAAATSLVLHGLLQVSEITSLSTYKYLKPRTLQRRDVSMQPYGTMKVTIQVSNTDQQAWGHQILIGCTGGTLCPALLIQQYLDYSQHHKSRPLLLFQSGHYHTHHIFVNGLHEYLLTVGANPKLYSTHSFHIRSTRAAPAAEVYPTFIRDLRCLEEQLLPTLHMDSAYMLCWAQWPPLHNSMSDSCLWCWILAGV